MVGMLLSACNVGGGKVKVSAPKFAAEGSEMTSDDFLKEFVTIDGYNVTPDGPAIKDSEYFKEDAKVSSKEMKSKSQNAETYTLTRDGKELEKVEEAQVTETTMQADTATNVIKSVMTAKASASSKKPEGKESESASYKQTAYLQEGKVNDVNGVVQALVERKTYALEDAFDTQEPRTFTSETWLNLYLQMIGQNAGEGLIYDIILAKILGGDLKGYKFYRSDKVYTIVYTDEQSETLKGQIATGEIEYATQTEKVESKRQMDVTEGKWVYKSSTVETEEVKYLKDYNGYFMSDVRLTKEETYSEVTLTSKNVNVKALDVSSYKVVA